ncbi:MAG TPA: hypothetical protein VKP64_00630 [Mycobacteriales bacterium]|nr:hypothetical protein [Mycobacteriales bacterium]
MRGPVRGRRTPPPHWRVVVLVLLAGLVAGLLTPTLLAARGSVARADPGPPGPVVVVGAAGLRWDDVSPARTPALWRLADRGSVGTLTVRAARARTCPPDGWLTLGGGNRARGPEAGPRCAPVPASVVGEGRIRSWPAIVAANRRLEFGSTLGALGTVVRAAGDCVTTVGPGAALTGADSRGRVPGHLPRASAAHLLSPGSSTTLRPCPLTIIAADDLAVRGRTAAAWRGIDAAVAAGTAVAGPHGTVLVAGVSEVGAERPRLHVAVAAGPRFSGGELRSASTRRAPYVQLIDVAPTVLALLGLEPPPSVVGQRWQPTPGPRAQSLPAHVARLVDLDRAAQEQRRLVPPFFALLVGAQAVLYLLAFTALRRLERGRHRDRVLGAARVAALAFAAAPVATYLAQLVPWWRHAHPLPVLLAAVAVADAAVLTVALAGPWRQRLLGPVGAVAGLTFAVLSLDVLTGARLQMSSLAGYSPLVAGRFAGFGNVSYAVFATGALLLTAALAAGRSRRIALLTVATVGTVAVVLDGSPTWGSDFGGVIALVPAFTVLGLLLTGARLSWRRLAAATAAGVLVVTAFALADYARPPDARTHVGRFVGQLLHGGAATIVRRKAESNLHLLTTSVLTLLVPVAVAFLGAVLRWPTSGLRRAFAHEPALRAGLLSVLVLGVVGFLVNDSGVAVPALAMSVAIPSAIAVSLSARDRPWPHRPRPATPAACAVHPTKGVRGRSGC